MAGGQGNICPYFGLPFSFHEGRKVTDSMVRRPVVPRKVTFFLPFIPYFAVAAVSDPEIQRNG